MDTIEQTTTQLITPYLTVNGAADAIAFYQKAVGATQMTRMPAQDGKRVMHACLAIKGGAVMLADEFPECADQGAPIAPSLDKPAAVAIAVACAGPDDVDATFRRAVDAGCIATMAPHDAFWGARFAMLGDPFGHRWMLSAMLSPK
jgi:PhnB protein